MTVRSLWTRESVIAVCLTAFFLAISHFSMGLSLGDNTWEMAAGGDVHPSTFLHLQYWSPLYALWFHLLSFVCPNGITRYFLSWGFLAILTALLPLLMRLPSAGIYTFFLVVFGFLTIGPYLGLFGGVFVLLGMCLVLKRKPTILQAVVGYCCLSFVLAFARPEYNYGVFLSSGVAIALLAVRAWRNRSRGESSRPIEGARSTVTTLSMGFIAICLPAVLLFIMAHSVRSRSGMAFAQHFNIRAVERGVPIVPAGAPWASNYAEQVFGIHLTHTALDEPGSVVDFMRASPGLFFGHVLRNLIDPKTIVLLIVLIAAIGWPWLRRDARSLRSASMYMLLASLPPLSGMLTIYPRLHYAAVMLPALTIYSLQAVRAEQWRRPSVPWVLAVGFSLIWLFNLQVRPRYDYDLSREKMDLSRARCLYAADQSAPADNLRVFDAVSMPPVYLARPRTSLGPADLSEWPQFERWVIQSHPAWIATTTALASQYGVAPADIDHFLAVDQGYAAHPCPSGADLTAYVYDKP